MAHPLAEAVPEVEALLALAPEELAAKLLWLLRTAPERMGVGASSGSIAAYSLLYGLKNDSDGEPAYDRSRWFEVSLAVREAWAWLEAQGLLIPAEGAANAIDGQRVLSRRAAAFESEAAVRSAATARNLAREALHVRLAESVWLDFMRGDYAMAAFRAMREVEIRLRETSGLAADLPAVRLARLAFAPGDGERPPGPLTDLNVEAGERQGMADLFAGALGALKNPHSHRDVDVEDPAEAASIVMFASYLLRVLDARVAQRGG